MIYPSYQDPREIPSPTSRQGIGISMIPCNFISILTAVPMGHISVNLNRTFTSRIVSVTKGMGNGSIVATSIDKGWGVFSPKKIYYIL